MLGTPQVWATPESAKEAGQRAKDVLASAGDLRGEARSLTCVADVLGDQGDLTEAKKMHEKALALAQAIGGRKGHCGCIDQYWKRMGS